MGFHTVTRSQSSIQSPIQGLALDHVGFVGPDLAAMREEWRRLGFRPTQPQSLFATTAAGDRVDLGQRSCHVMFEQGYIELTEVRDRAPDHHLAPWLARGPGLRIVAYSSRDVRAFRADQSEPGMSPVMAAMREVDYGDLAGSMTGQAHFLWCMRNPTLTPAALECIVEHQSAELIFQACVQQQPNSVQALRAVEIKADQVTGLVLVARELAAVRRCLTESAVPFTECAGSLGAESSGGSTIGAQSGRAASPSIRVALASAPGCAVQFVTD